MLNPDEFLESINQKLSTILNQSKQSSEELKDNIRSLIQSQLTKLDVVNREEFDSQQAILLKTRAQLIQLEQQLKDLEKQIEDQARQIK